ncbi:MAG: alginate export family protein [Chitinophagales bacterium]
MRKFLINGIQFITGITPMIMLFILTPLLKANAQSSFTLSAIIRPRFELQYGYRVPPDSLSDPQLLFSQRTRLNAAYNSDRFNAFLSFQDARIWGDQIQGTDVPSLGIHEAWVQYNFNKKIGLRLGRQEYKYDNKRLLTDGDWPQQGRSHDGGMLKLALDRGWKIDLAASYNQQTQTYFNNFYSLSNYKTLDFLWVNKTKTDSNYNYSASALILADGNQSPDTTGIIMRYTYGINTAFDHHRWGLNLEAYGQSGRARTINQSGNIVPDSFQTVKAFMFSVNPWVEVFRDFQIGVGIDYLTGSDALDTSSTGTTNMFNPQYGAGDKFYGKMDVYVNLPTDTRNGGLIDGYLSVRYLYKKWNLSAVYHYYSLENQVEDVENPGQALGKALGTELNLAAIKDITKDVNINTGVAFFFPTRSMEFVKSSSFSQLGGPLITGVYVYVMLTFKPVFFSKKSE